MTFLQWFTGTFTPAAPLLPVAPKPDIDLPPAPTTEQPAVVTDTVITIEHKRLGRWWQIAEPVYSSVEVPASKCRTSRYVFSKLRVTVVAGELNIAGVTKGRFHNMAVIGVGKGQVFKAGESFEASFAIGPLTTHDRQVSGGIHTEELGRIILLGAMVIFDK